MKKTVTDLVKSIPERLGLELDLSTPQKVYDFLNDEDFPIFYMSGESRNFVNYVGMPMYTDWIVKCGHKSMYIFNDLFSPEPKEKDDIFNKYNVCFEDAMICDLVDYDDNIGYYSDISFYEKENTQYIAILSTGVNNFKNVIDACAKICIETNDYIHFECYGFDNQTFGYDIAPDGSVSKFGTFLINDNNADSFSGDLSVFILLFGCNTFEEMEEVCVPYIIKISEQKSIDANCGLFYCYKNKASLKSVSDEKNAANIVEEFPIAIDYLSIDLQKSKPVALAFIQGNEPYMETYNKIKNECTIFADGTWMQLGELLAGQTANLSLNGLMPKNKWSGILNEEVWNAWCSDIEIFKKILCSSMYGYCTISNKAFEEFDHRALFNLSPHYASILRNYYREREEKLDEETRKKEDLHIRRKYRLSDDVSSENIVLLKTFEILEESKNDAIKALSLRLNDYELTSLVKDYLLSLPKEERDLLIKSNIRLAYPIRNALSNDEEIVEYICEMCECAGDFLSDEIVEVRGLKRTNLDISKVCEDCNYC